MLHALKKPEALSPCLEYAVVRENSGAACLVEGDFGEVRAAVALSCLIAPRAGDRVLLSLGPESHVLAVLSRAEGGAPGAEIAFQGDVTLAVSNGRLALSAEQELSLGSAGTLSCAARTLKLAADKADAKLGLVNLVAERLVSQIKRVKTVARQMDTICRRWTQRLGECFRYVDEHDELQAGSQRVLVEELMTLQAKNTMLQAEEHVMVNAEQIHLN